MQPPNREGRAAAWWRRASPTQRLRVLAIPLATPIVAVCAFHVVDASRNGESPWGVLLGIGVAILSLVTAFVLAFRPVAGLTPAEGIRIRTRQLMWWAAPVAAALAIVAAIAQAVLSRR